MNLLILAGFGCGTIALLWIAQTLALLATGTRACFLLPYRHDGESSLVRWSMKLALHAGLLSMIFLYPWVIGFDPWQYHLERIVPLDWQHALSGVALTASLLSMPLLVSLAVGWVRIENRYRASKLIYKLVRSFLIPLPLTLVEEPLFRGVVLEQFLAALPSDPAGWSLAVVLSSLIFASVHFVKPQKRSVLPFIGLFGLGVILSLAYIRTDHHYLLPMTIHGTGVCFVQLVRCTTRYGGPAWLVGHASYPICGAMGLTAMTAMGVIIMSGYEPDHAGARSPAMGHQGMFGPHASGPQSPRKIPEVIVQSSLPLTSAVSGGDIQRTSYLAAKTHFEDGYRSFTGQLGKTYGSWSIHYAMSPPRAGSSTALKFAPPMLDGCLFLRTEQDMTGFQPGDLVHIQGDLDPQGIPSYHVRSIKLIERGAGITGQ